MIVQLTGTLVEASPSFAVLDVGGVGYGLGISSTTAAALPAIGEPGVMLHTRMVVREDACTLYGFATREERSLFDRLCTITGVGPKLALAVLSLYGAADLAQIVLTGDVARMSAVPGVGKKLANRLILELESVFATDIELRGYAGLSQGIAASHTPAAAQDSVAEVVSALLSMGFTHDEATLALEGHEQTGAHTPEQLVAYALRRLGGGR